MGDADASALGRVRWLVIFGALALVAATVVALVTLTKDQTNEAPPPAARSLQLDPLPLADIATGEPRWSLLSAADGTVRWQVPLRNYELHAANDTTVLVTAASQVVALDLATGAERWRRTGWWPATIAGQRPFGRIFEVATGKPVLTFGDTAESCAGDAAMIACQVYLDEGSAGVATFGVHDRQAVVSALEPTDGYALFRVRSAAHSYPLGGQR